ncbi:MAG: hypothetical protein J2P28_05770 [Actinobacteria bacterium]|nr:hypothetical protein [Actinomycetota bacterium]
MVIDSQTLNDAIVALLVTVGIAVALSLALTAAAAIHQRDKARGSQGASQPTRREQADDSREPILR